MLLVIVFIVVLDRCAILVLLEGLVVRLGIYTNKSVGFTLASFDFLRFWTTFTLQINARKTHADT